MEVEGGKVQGNIPPGASTLSQGLLVEVDDKEVTINRRDFHTNSWTGEPWKIKLPTKKKDSTMEKIVIKKSHTLRRMQSLLYQM